MVTALVLLALMIALGAGALAWYAIVVAPGALQLTMVDAPIAGLPAPFHGYRIAILSDFHHGPQQPIERAQRAVAFANSQAPDLVVLLGDYGTSEGALPVISRRWYQRSFAALAPVLARLRSRDGILAVIGNHDFYASADETHRWLESLGVHVLRGAAIDFPSIDGPLRFIGVDDAEGGEIDAALVACLAAGDAPTIVLSHHPDAVRHAGHPSVRLVLSGHTHGGQVVLPWIGAPVTRSIVCTRHHPAGWVPNPHAPLFVSRGIGSQIPIRFRAPPEVVILTLRATPARSLPLDHSTQPDPRQVAQQPT